MVMNIKTTKFKEVYTKYARDVFRFSFWLSGSYDEANDIASETFLRMWTAKQELHTQTVKAYLFTIARNLYLKSQQAKRKKTILDEHIVGPANIIEEQEIKSRLEVTKRALQNLSVAERSVIIMRSFENMSYTEIARAMGLSLSAVKVKIHRARTKLLLKIEE